MTQRRAAVLLLLPWMWIALAGCGKDNPPDASDAGTVPQGDGGGVISDGGQTGEDAGVNPGTDAGNPNIECDLAAPACAAGTSCLTYALSSGALGTRCFPGACDVVEQDCPAGDGGQKCTYVQSSGDGGVSQRTCVPDGTAQEGERCTGTPTSNTCAAGLICVPRMIEDGGTIPQCMRYCSTSADCTAGTACLLMLDLSPSPERPFVCERACDLLAQDCAATEACYPTAIAPACYASPGATSVGGPCIYSSECVRGAVCVKSKCAQLCAFPSGTPSCTSGACTRLQIAGQQDAGACL